MKLKVVDKYIEDLGEDECCLVKTNNGKQNLALRCPVCGCINLVRHQMFSVFGNDVDVKGQIHCGQIVRFGKKCETNYEVKDGKIKVI